MLQKKLNLLIEQEIKTLILELFGRFKWKKFKSLPDTYSMIEYARTHLKYIDRGSARIVFALNNKYALKISVSSYNNQNEKEVEIYTALKSNPIITKIFDYDEKFHWVVSELVRPISSRHEFKQLAGITLVDFTTIINIASFLRRDNRKADITDIIEYTLSPQVVEVSRLIAYEYSQKFVKRIVHQIKTNQIVIELLQSGMHLNDLQFIFQWGKTADGRLVALDYGMA